LFFISNKSSRVYPALNTQKPTIISAEPALPWIKTVPSPICVISKGASFSAAPDDTDFIVEVPDVPTTKQLTINCKGKDIEIDAVRLINEDIDSIISDLQIKTLLKEQIGRIMFSNLSIERKRLEIRKMQKRGLDKVFVNMFMKLLEYVAQI
jgi:hypothetical protein